jgi:TonB family protein
VPPPEAAWPSLDSGAALFPSPRSGDGFSTTFEALDADPVLLNSEQIAAEMAQHEPATDEETLGDPVLGLAIDRRGVVTHLLVAQSSGSARIDAAAIDVMQSARYSPGVFRGSAVQVYLLLPVHFQ